MRAEHRDDSLTLASLGILAFALADVTHEALGHGLASLAAGAKPVLLTTCYLVTTGSASHWIPAGGGIANIGVGLLSLLCFWAFHLRSPHFAYFLVLAAAFNLLFAAGYPAYSGIALFGDWAAVISGLTPPWLWRILLVVISVVLYYVSLELLAYAIRPFFDDRQPGSTERLRRVSLLPYLAALVAACMAGAFNPSGWTVIFTSGLPAPAAAFGLTQLDHFPRAISRNPTLQAAGPITRSYRWIAAASLTLALFVGVLGPGIRFNNTP